VKLCLHYCEAEALKTELARLLADAHPGAIPSPNGCATSMRSRTRKPTSYLWPAPVEGRLESDITHLNAQQAALSRWIRIEWAGKAFLAVEPQGDLGQPEWPELAFQEVLELGLTGHLINNENHPFIIRLLGRS